MTSTPVDLSGKRLFITGGTGFVGKTMLDYLAESAAALGCDFSVTVLTRSSGKFLQSHPEYEGLPWLGFVDGDLATLATAVEGKNPKKGNVGIAMAAVAGVTALDVYCAQTLSRESPHPLPPMQDYSDRTGYPRGIEESHGAARDFEVPRDFRTPEALRPYTQPEPPRHPQPSM